MATLTEASDQPATPDPAVVATPTTPFPAPRVGLSLAGFEVVVGFVGGRDALLNRSTEWLKQHIVKPHTQAARVPYSELLRARPNGAELVGPATHFLSHAYSMPFLYSLDAAAAWAARNPRGDGAPHFFLL